MIAEVSFRPVPAGGPSEDWSIKMPYTPPFHTKTFEEHPVFHDNSACRFGQEVKRDGNALPGDDNRDRCERCEELNAKGE